MHILTNLTFRQEEVTVSVGTLHFKQFTQLHVYQYNITGCSR